MSYCIVNILRAFCHATISVSPLEFFLAVGFLPTTCSLLLPSLRKFSKEYFLAHNHFTLFIIFFFSLFICKLGEEKRKRKDFATCKVERGFFGLSMNITHFVILMYYDMEVSWPIAKKDLSSFASHSLISFQYAFLTALIIFACPSFLLFHCKFFAFPTSILLL